MLADVDAMLVRRIRACSVRGVYRRIEPVDRCGSGKRRYLIVMVIDMAIGGVNPEVQQRVAV